MKTLTVRRQISPPANLEVNDFEETYGILLPEDFKDFLRQYNLIDCEENLFILDREKFYLDVFYPLSKVYELSLEVVYQNLRDYFQDEFVAFANDSGGWQYIISVKMQDYGAVYFCRMDDVPPSSLRLLANSFSEFMNNLSKS